MIHVAYSTSNLYAKFAGTSMLSLFENTNSDVTVHILHDSTLTNDNREKFSYVAGRYNQRVVFHNAEEICAQETAEFKLRFPKEKLERFSIAATFRLMMPNIFPTIITKVISLDADTIINLDIAELWRVELGDKPLAAVLEWEDPRVSMNLDLCRDGIVKPEDYFNLGVSIVNLERLRNESTKIRGGVDAILKTTGWDQDIWNYCFSTEYLKLPSKFNTWVYRDRNSGKTAIERKIYHYIGQASSLGLDARDNFHRLYWEYFAKTPWFNAETILNFGEGARQMYIERQNFAVQVSAMMSGKTRAFFTEPALLPMLKQAFAVSDAEEIIALTSNESIQRLANSMTAARGQKVFFVLISQPAIYQQLREMLTRLGFVEGRDFVNALAFLSEAQGIPTNFWSIIKNL